MGIQIGNKRDSPNPNLKKHKSMARCMSVVCSEQQSITPEDLMWQEHGDGVQRLLTEIKENIKNVIIDDLENTFHNSYKISNIHTGLSMKNGVMVSSNDKKYAVFVPYGEVVLYVNNQKIGINFDHTLAKGKYGFTFHAEADENGVDSIEKVVYTNLLKKECTTSDIGFVSWFSNEIAHKFVDIISEYDTEGDDDEPQQEPDTKLDQDSNGVKRGRDEEDGEQTPKKSRGF